MTTTDHDRIARRFYELLAAKDIDAWIELWHDEGRIIVPYPPEGFDSSIDGREQILAAFKGLFANYESFRSTLTAVYPAADSDAVCVEYTNHAVVAGGVEYTNTNIAVFRFRDGLIIAYHDYFDPRRFQVVIDALPTG
ncbi:nuclear transport factor 2 family protein [Kutzneria kofuensis]|uniref:Ketosteroid isomerase-like protein n=1 Tax=Kutzneria kofuensis TaxID=103725 RepID=A0A7W9KC26_9PSEU|nr:nuclear transport factor 2 family protein [Kutzneria kofuensis]MBB5889771.1 ketosteroid isomerase-like protein [Kutzneria kofuensis]